jgi:S-DNA-T family DNA segregation ATPase FtsK/SpoIIIE
VRLKVTLARQSGQSDDIVVTTDAVATVADVAAAIRRLDPRGQEWAVGGEGRVLTLAVAMPGQQQPDVLSPDIPIGEAQIGDGATVLLADSTSYGATQLVASRPAARLRVLTGAASGREFPIAAGSTTIIGRDPACDIVLDDPFVSGRHARIQASPASLELIDLGSANGLVVDGGIVDRLPVRQPVRVLIGDTEVELTPAPQPQEQASVTAAPAVKPGPVLFNRSPKVEARYVGAQFEVPEVPAETEPQPMPLLALATPILMAGVMYMITRQPASVAFAAMSPLMVVGNWFMGKSQRKSKLKKSIERFDEGLEALTASLGREREREAAQRALETPSTEEVYDAATRRTPMLWTRRPEHWSFLNVRLGVGAVTSRNTIDVTSRPNLLVEFQDRLDAVIAANRTVPGVPIAENLYDAGAIGVAGDPARTAGALNSLLVQLTGLHSPAELTVAAIVSSRWSREVEWLKWMPHSSSPHSPLEGNQLADSESSASTLLSNLEGLIAERLEARRGAERRGAVTQGKAATERGANVAESDAAAGTQSPIPAVVVVVSDDAPVDRGRLIQLAESAADAGVFPIWVSPDVPSLPAVCRSYLAVDAEGRAEVGFVRLGEHITDVVTEPIDGQRAQAYAHLMAPVVDAGAPVADASDLPRSISLVTLLGHDLAESSAAVVDRWKQNDSIHDRSGGPLTQRRAGKLRAIVGSSGHDPMHLDLRTQGPHALVGGTTGAGKSEFLQAWVLGMAAEYSPDRVTFLFVDYKGGSAFADCVQLPHCVGLVTDLSPHLVRRALTSLRAELHHREHLFNRKKAKDLLELEKRGDPDSPPALVLVIDEFAALAGEVPEFVDGVVDIAQRGRSLGIHLIMATQRPAGVIKDNLRANTNMRVALRMADESDSQDVIGVKDSAHIDPSIPGRGFAKTGPGRLAAFQSGYAGGWTTREPERADIQVAELRFGGENRWEDAAAPASVPDQQRDLGPNDQQRLVATMIGAHGLAGIPNPRRPWLDELAPVYDLSRLRQRTDAELLLGVADVPERQEQSTQYFRPDVDGHLAIFGTSGSGKTTVLRTLASAAAITPRGGPVHVYGLDYGAGSLRILDRLPHVGAIVTGEDTERIIRLFRTLQGELERRAAAWAEVNAAGISEYRQLAGRPAEPRILLLIDNFTNFKDDFEVAAGRAQWYDVFRDVLADGRRLGIHVALTADRAGAVPTSIAASIQRRVVLRLADDGYGTLGVPGDILTPASPPGRAIVDGLEAQIAILGGTTSVSEQGEALGKLAEAMTRAGVAAAPAIGSLPKEYAQSSLPASVADQPVLGISDVDLGPYPFEPSGTVLLAGPPASGRTTALQSIATALARADGDTRLYYIGNGRSPLARLELWADTATTPDEAAALARDLAAAVTDPDTEGRIAVFVETIGDFLQTPADGPLVELTKAVRRSDHLLVAEAETSAWGSSWPLFGEVKNGRRGILLQPEAIEGDILLKTALPRMARSEFPPGRGVYIARGQHARVQLPLPG